MEERTTEFCVGDKVIYGNRIGKIINITPKRKDMTVDFGTHESVFDVYGRKRHRDKWDASQIVKWTPEGQKKIDDTIAIRRCQIMFENISGRGKLTPDQAREIIKILTRKEEE